MGFGTRLPRTELTFLSRLSAASGATHGKGLFLPGFHDYIMPLCPAARWSILTVWTRFVRTNPKTTRQSASPAQPGKAKVPPDVLQVVEGIGGGGWTRTNDLRIMRPSL